ncbi:hypothetical protein ABMA28_014638 [Loxostege sticticalis]|uniref:RNase H type-1 domain-containing protein n=1 Tax=Loxostege sticticalis TaxID=481309 RepID=A0ABD0TBV1_LOXSC
MAFYDLKQKTGHGIKLPSNTSIYTAEAYALLAALQFIEKLDTQKWLIISDSMSVLEALSNPCHSAKTNYLIFEIKEKYAELINTGKDIVLFWSPSHIGVVGNEKADNFAKFITTTSDFVPVRRIKVPWLEHWQKTLQTKGTWYREINDSIRAPWFNKGTYNNRKFYSYLTRLRIGHGRFNEHLHRVNMITSPSCTFCNIQAIQSLHHIFFECSEFSLQRIILIDDLLEIYKKPEDIPRRLQDLLKNQECYKALFKFISSTIEEI